MKIDGLFFFKQKKKERKRNTTLLSTLPKRNNQEKHRTYSSKTGVYQFWFLSLWEQILREFNSSPDICNICRRGYELRKQRDLMGISWKPGKLHFCGKLFIWSEMVAIYLLNPCHKLCGFAWHPPSHFELLVDVCWCYWWLM